MVSGITSNMIENFANFNESFHDKEKGGKLTAEDMTACQALIDENMNIEPVPEPDMPGPVQGEMPDISYMNDKSILQEMSEISNEFDTPNLPDVSGEEETTEEFGDYESPVYEGFTNSDFNASTLVRGRNLHNLLKALLIALVLCSLNHKDVSRMVVEPLVRLTHNKISRTTMVCVLIFLVAYLVIALL
jgi:hypothetical protein